MVGAERKERTAFSYSSEAVLKVMLIFALDAVVFRLRLLTTTLRTPETTSTKVHMLICDGSMVPCTV